MSDFLSAISDPNSKEAKALALALKIVLNIKGDFTDRRGLRQEWEQIDEDIQEEILRKWTMETTEILLKHEEHE